MQTFVFSKKQISGWKTMNLLGHNFCGSLDSTSIASNKLPSVYNAHVTQGHSEKT